MSARLEPYVYEPLPDQHIRVLRSVVPLKEEEPLTWSFLLLALGDSEGFENVAYEALSYTWGSSTELFPLICDGRELLIHFNLYQALPYLANRPSELPLWIDAVCINQSDEAEKMRQIQMMSRIYRFATRVWVWLGDFEEPHAKEAVETLLPRIEALGTRLEQLGFEEYLSPSQLDVPELNSPIWMALGAILESPWFLRLWIVQEAALAREIKCLFGANVIEWEVLSQAIFDATKLRSIKDENGQKLSIPVRNTVNYGAAFNCRSSYDSWARADERDSKVATMVRRICNATRMSQCTEPRDQVLALLGFLTSEGETGLGFDENTSLEELYLKFGYFILQPTDERRDFDFSWWAMFRSGICANKNKTLPSWCPDFRQRRLVSDRFFSYWRDNSVRVSKRQRLCKPGRSTREIVVHGSIIDTVERLGNPFPYKATHKGDSEEETLSWLLDLREWEGKVCEMFELSTQAATDETEASQSPEAADETYWRTLVCNVTNFKGLYPTYDGFLKYRSAFPRMSLKDRKLGIEGYVTV